MPNPTATGVSVTVLIDSTIPSISVTILLRIPVTPIEETK